MLSVTALTCTPLTGQRSPHECLDLVSSVDSRHTRVSALSTHVTHSTVSSHTHTQLIRRTQSLQQCRHTRIAHTVITSRPRARRTRYHRPQTREESLFTESFRVDSSISTCISHPVLSVQYCTDTQSQHENIRMLVATCMLCFVRNIPYYKTIFTPHDSPRFEKHTQSQLTPHTDPTRSGSPAPAAATPLYTLFTY